MTKPLSQKMRHTHDFLSTPPREAGGRVQWLLMTALRRTVHAADHLTFVDCCRIS